jgi:hypothetical protein
VRLISMFLLNALYFSSTAMAVVPVPYDVNTPLPVAMTYCYPGVSCITCDSEMPRAKVNQLLELKLTEGEVLLFTPDPKNPQSHDWLWTATGSIWPAVVEQEYSGKGNRNQPPACANRAALAGSHQPKDGFWKVSQDMPELQNCAGAKPQAVPESREKAQFDKPFRGRISSDESFASIIQIAPNSYASIEDEDANLSGQTLLDVLSPTSFKLHTLARNKNLGNSCTMRYTIHFTYDGAY